MHAYHFSFSTEQRNLAVMQTEPAYHPTCIVDALSAIVLVVSVYSYPFCALGPMRLLLFKPFTLHCSEGNHNS